MISSCDSDETYVAKIWSKDGMAVHMAGCSAAVLEGEDAGECGEV